ncbi:PACE efflux transporter [Desulfogranum mediterraneum]|uniref:PACE efflux transporter n=1 Tax=Desulfogranum mediterraneum TaxID=160661 RepID=UPI00048E02F6|nr:PACE efflux transporter [Desulfogranum mediterraneum]
MRSTKDRVRHTVLFEIGLVLLCSPMVSIVLEKDILHTGGLTICLSVIAMIVNYLYNVIFDHVLLRLGRSLANRSAKLRAIHAILFEASLLLAALPLIAFTLDLSLWQAFLTDVGFSTFALIYAFAFNWAYDYFLPIPDTAPM